MVRPLHRSLGKVGDDVPCVQDAEYFRDAFLAVQELVNKGLILAGHDISAGGLITTLLEMCFANVEGGMEINLDKIEGARYRQDSVCREPGYRYPGQRQAQGRSEEDSGRCRRRLCEAR